ncbi:unnamed protein product, partial [marine sediment metagenome]
MSAESLPVILDSTAVFDWQSYLPVVLKPAFATPPPEPTPPPNPMIYFLSPSGNDSNSGTTESEAWATFSKAMQYLYPGDTLVLLDGLYNQTIYPTRNGEPGNPITIMALHDGQAIIDGEEIRYPIQIENKSYYELIGLVAKDGNPEVIRVAGDNNILRRIS